MKLTYFSYCWRNERRDFSALKQITSTSIYDPYCLKYRNKNVKLTNYQLEFLRDLIDSRQLIIKQLSFKY